jgi:SHS2 domain-containing protein
LTLPPYERVDDGGGEPVVRAFGATIGEVFEQAAYAMFDIGYELENVTPTYARPVSAAGDTLAELLVGWLRELLAMSAVEGIIPSFFMVDRLEEGGVQGSASGLFTPDVVARRRVVGDVLTRSPQFVEIPDGFWVELRFEPVSPLRQV